MKKLILNLLFLCGTTIVFAQPKPTPAPQAMNKKDSMICQKWTLASIEEFGVDSPPDAKQKGDGLTFSLDKKAEVTHDGVTKKGTWSTDKAKSVITVAVESGEKRNYRIFKLTSDSLCVEYQDVNLIRTKFNYTRSK